MLSGREDAKEPFELPFLEDAGHVGTSRFFPLFRFPRRYVGDRSWRRDRRLAKYQSLDSLAVEDSAAFVFSLFFKTSIFEKESSNEKISFALLKSL